MDLTIQRILEEMQIQNKQQTELGEYLNVTPNIITDWKSGRLKSYKKYLHGISDFLNVSVEYLRGETDIKEKPLSENEERLKELYDATADFSETEIQLLKAYAAGIKANRKNR